ncbi:MAG: manganese catalase family protein [Balneolaceae bacterium]
MFYHEPKLQYKVKVDKPNPQFARMLQQAIGGIEGEIRVCLQYLFQAWGSRGPNKYRDMLLDTGTEEMSHIEILATAVAKNLEGAPADAQEKLADENPMVKAIMGGMNPQHILSSGLSAMPADSNGNPFNGSWVVGTGNIAADMHANVTAESGGRTLDARLWEITDDPGMKDMLSFLIARDTMHQNQWLAVLEEMGYKESHPIPDSFPQDRENKDFNYNFISTNIHKNSEAKGRWTSGDSIDGKGTFSFEDGKPHGEIPDLGIADPKTYAQKSQMGKKSKSVVDKVKEEIT